MMLLWRQVYRPVLSITEQQFMMWFVVALFPHSLHLSDAPNFQRFRFAGVGRVSMQAFSINFRVPDFNWNMLDFHTRSTFSLAAKASRPPCTCSFSTWLFRLSCSFLLVASFTFVLMLVLKVCWHGILDGGDEAKARLVVVVDLVHRTHWEILSLPSTCTLGRDLASERRGCKIKVWVSPRILSECKIIEL